MWPPVIIHEWLSSSSSSSSSSYLIIQKKRKGKEASGSLVGALSREEVNRCERADAYRLFIPRSMKSSSSRTTERKYFLSLFLSSFDDVALKNKLFFSFFLSFFLSFSLSNYEPKESTIREFITLALAHGSL